MSQSTFGNSTMAYTNNSRPFTNLGNTTPSDKTNGTALNSSFYSKRSGWASNSIWGSGSLSNGLNSRDATRDNSRSRDTRPSSSGEEVIEGKTGSGSLVNSSVTDDFSYRTSWGAKRSLPSGRSISQANYAEAYTFQPRSASNAGLPSSFSNTSQNPTGFASRPPTISLNPTSNAHTRPAVTSPYSFGFAGRGSDQPPTVYTKFDRPSEPTSRKLPDSAKDGLWVEYSPTDERKPFNLTFGNRTASTPASRDGSLPSSHHGEEQPFFTRPDYGRSSQRPTQNNSRAPSISSQANSINNFLNSNTDHLSWQLNQINLSNNRSLTSHKGSVGSNAIFNRPSPTSATSPFARSPIPGLGLADDNEESDRVGMNYYNQDQFMSPHQLGAYPDYAQNGLDGRNLQTPTTNDLTQRQSFANGSLPPHLLGLPSGGRSNASWAATPEADAAGARRLGDLPDQSQYLDFRLQQQMLAPGFRNGYQQLYNPFNVHPALQINAANGFVPMIPLAMSPVDANIDARALNDRAGESMQSLLMYDFKQNQKTRRYELKDIFDHIAEFSGDQHGSRFIQTKLESANSDDKERVFKEIEPNAIQLMTDVFGNYVIQKFFEHGDQRHKKILANKMKGEVLNLSLQMYGCRVVQKALDHVLVDQQHELVCELGGSVLKCVKDQNGNHVIQKAIERCQPGSIRFIIQAFRGEVQHLSIHPYGCRVIQRCLERCEPTMKAMIMEELMACVDSLICDQFGNYVVQHVLEHDEGHGRNLVLDIVARSLEAYSKHKFASNVVEDCLTYSNEDWRRKAVMVLASGHPQRSEGEGVFVSMIKDNYGNYVIQRLLETLPPDDYVQFVDLLHPALSQAKRTGCGKQVVAIEKKMHRLPGYHGGSTNGGAYNPHAFRLPVPPFANPIDSATTTPPPLTADTRSLQSSALQSIDGDAVEGATAICNRKGANQSPAGFYQ